MQIIDEKYQLNISVRGLVEFLLRTGDIDNRRGGGGELSAMQEGSRIHKLIQGKGGSNYQAEVPLFYVHKAGIYDLKIEGRADGIIKEGKNITIDEIKGTYRNIEKMKEPAMVHLAQAKCYAYMYCIGTNGDSFDKDNINIRVTYCNLETENIRYFLINDSFDGLEKWFLELLEDYNRWAILMCKQYQDRQESIGKLAFPFEYRPGQKELAVQVYQSINDRKKLFLEAPTGVGKTITTIFPSIKAIGVGKADRLFYFTAKTITRTVASDAFTILRNNGLKFRSVVITSKDKICFCEERDCNPENCEYANKHFDRINDALYSMLYENEVITREVIEVYAKKYRVCPYELTLDATLFADGIVCDYNYLFDPHVKLQRFFGEGAVSGHNIFLIDEAHNLLERGRDMYSAILHKDTFLKVKKEIKDFAKDEENKSVLVKNGYAQKIVAAIDRCNKVLLEMKRDCDNNTILEFIDEFTRPLNRLYNIFSNYYEEREKNTISINNILLDFFFEISHFLEIYEVMDENYAIYSQIDDDGDFSVKLFCMNPANNLKECMKFGRSTILFSATFLPIQYYKKLLGGEKSDYEVYAKSVFDPQNSKVLVAKDVTSKYTRRSEGEFIKIAEYIDKIVHAKRGNYMVFCPSHSFMGYIFEIYKERFEAEDEQCIIQQEIMTEDDREDFLSLFNDNDNLTAFCVLGGIFGEGIDLKDDKLIGAVIVGTGLPQVCFERELLKNHFNKDDNKGFDYAYRYPGMNKVLQAAGRVIRTESDRGIIALMDERFIQNSYASLFPREWSNASLIDMNTIKEELESFWNLKPTSN